jgi:hypothetical protein
MLKKTLSAIIFIGILLITLACLGGAVTEQASTPTEGTGIYLKADGSGDYADMVFSSVRRPLQSLWKIYAAKM